MTNIVVIEDDLDIRDLLAASLSLNGFEVETFIDGKEAFDALSSDSSSRADLFIIDRMLPKISGGEICKALRESDLYSSHPIIFLTAMTDKANIIEGLDYGADDYMTKPFDIDELLARVRALLRRLNKKPKSNVGNIVAYKGLTIYLEEYKVELDTSEVHLTKTEFQLLSELMSNHGKVQSRSSLILKIQGDNTHVTERTVDTHLTSLRKKIKPYGKNIETIRGVGYKFVH